MKKESVTCHDYCCISHFSLTSLYNTVTRFLEPILEECISKKWKHQLLIVSYWFKLNVV